MDNWVFVLPSFNLFGHPYAPFGSGSLVFAPFRIGSLALDLQDVAVHRGVGGLRDPGRARRRPAAIGVRATSAGHEGQSRRVCHAGHERPGLAHRSLRLLGRPGGGRRRHLRHGPRQRGTRRLPVLQRALRAPGDGYHRDHLVRCGGVERPLPGIAALHQSLPVAHPVAAGPRRPRRHRGGDHAQRDDSGQHPPGLSVGGATPLAGGPDRGGGRGGLGAPARAGRSATGR